ncbi:MAG: HD domain-containing protein [Candidatus Omnitrophica bacterium]|nr:HD domain-containing protein [Candidatus Omnitrophota bacterium]
MRIVWANKFLENWFGPLSEIRGKHCYEIYEKRNKMCPRCPTAKIFKCGYDICVSIRRGIQTNDGIKRCVKLTNSPIRDENGKIVQVLELVEDVTEHLKLDREVKKRLRIVTKELDSISRLDKQFTSFNNLSLDKVLKQCIEITQILMGSKICSLRLIDGAQKTVSCKTSSGLSTDYLKDLRIGEGICGKVAEIKRPLIIKDLITYRGIRIDDWIKEKGLHSLICVPILLKGEVIGTLAVFDKRVDAFTKDDCNLLLCFANHIAILIDNVTSHKEVFESYLDTIKSLVSAVEARDSYTRGHSEKVTKFALDIANAMELSENERAILTYSGRLHDIGKIGISDLILCKAGPLTVAERAEMQLHPLKAVEILANLKFLESGIPAIKHHHERYDGRGYPDGLKGNDIPLLARIMACADAFDAMTSDRAYRHRMSIKDALAEIRTNKEKQFDPQIADIFIDIIKSHGL